MYFFSHSSGGWKPKIKEQAVPVSPRWTRGGLPPIVSLAGLPSRCVCVGQSGRHNRISQSRWLVNTTRYCSRFWRLKSQIKTLTDSVTGEDPPPGSLCPHMVAGARECRTQVSYNGTNPKFRRILVGVSTGGCKQGMNPWNSTPEIIIADMLTPLDVN